MPKINLPSLFAPALVLATSAVLGGCATGGIHDESGRAMATNATPQIDGSWQQLRLRVPEKHANNVLYLKPDGGLRIDVGSSGRGVDGRWNIQAGNLCLQVEQRVEECISHPRILEKGETVGVTSNQGWRGEFTMLTDPTGTPLADAMSASPVAALRR